jgi:ABC-type antimicrobial peptide transport system permease subunit
MQLDDQLAATASMVGVVLTFVFGYFVALFPYAEEVRDRQAPADAVLRRALHERLSTMSRLFVLLFVATFVTAVVLATAIASIAAATIAGEPLNVIRILFIGVEVGVVTLAIGAWLEYRRMARRRLAVYDYRPANGKSLRTLDSERGISP